MDGHTDPQEAKRQEAVFALLTDPATHGGAAVQRIDTHAASVFLAGDRVFKVKRAVRFPFLDYSTVAKRKAACEAELEVNHPFAPQIYRRVVPITRSADGTLAIGGNGEPVDWAVEMRRFEVEETLDHLADRGEIDATFADALGRAVAKAHAQAPSVAPEPWIKALGKYVEQNDTAFREASDLFPTDKVDALSKASRVAYTRLQPLLAERGRHGLIRRGHGDLHLGNIVRIDGAPVLFDAIEFDPLIASGDVLYDLAFLLMDLIERGLLVQANVVLNRYLTDTHRAEDLDALAALPLYLSVRAAIRAMVTAARRDQAEPAKRAPIGRDAVKYFDLACALIDPAPPVMVAVGGLSGTGKSVLARGLAPGLAPPPGAVVLRTDVERKALFGKRESEPLPEDAYTPEISARVYAALAAKAQRVANAGHSVIVDAVFAQRDEREMSAKAATDIGVVFHGLFLTADLAVRVARVGGRSGDASDADARIAREQEAYEIGALGDWREVDASGTPEQTLRNARAAMRV